MGFPNNEKLAEGIVILSAVQSPTPGTSAVAGPAIDLSSVRKVLTMFIAGALAAGETVTCSLQGCATSGGSYTAIPNSSVTLLKSVPDTNKTQVIEVNAEDIQDLGLGYRFIQAVFQCAVGSPMTIVSIGGGGPEEPIGFGSQATTLIKGILNV